ncbi:MAG: ribosome-associated translation inhibitor RaiA [Desulfobacterales bacterium]|nr:ribosome-associated translation inhibitor RaiA [Desulfobacterales bacterium]MDJ0874956.1 ribosome-associated translation inhibitor RaiA [Desulfobacterales bacterium]MDJ0884561.1 ribosome-associated translation inhibitor RaiA [Desulfobacterales bacterium]
MQTSVTFKNLDSSEHLKSYVSDKLNRFDRLLDNPAGANVVLRVEKFRHIAEININGDRMTINGREETEDMYSAIDMVLDKLEKQIKKGKEKTRERRSKAKAKAQTNSGAARAMELEDDQPKQVKIKNIDYKPMDVDEAVLQMDLTSDNFLVFTNARTDQINVLYRRHDGDLGLIQPSS